MQTDTHPGQPHGSSSRNPLRVYCEACRHTEFVHGDIATRECLYSECGCGGFTLSSAA
jgi:hypothetical protein